MKSRILLSVFIFSILSGKIYSQAFEKGNITLSPAFNLGVYGTEINEEYTSIQGLREKNTETDAAVSMIIPVMLEYGIKDWLGVGVRFGYSAYLTGTDSVEFKSKVNGIDGTLFLNLHLIKSRKRFDMPISAQFGYSNLKIDFNDNQDLKAEDGGYTYGFSLLPRIYITKHFGFQFNVGYVAYVYPSLQFSDKTSSDVNARAGKDWNFRFEGSGVNLGAGLILKF